MNAEQPRTVAYRGSVEAAGFAFEIAALGEPEVRRRVLACWQPGATLRTLDKQRWVLELPVPVRMRAETAPGAVLVRDAAGNLFAAPLSAGERASLDLRVPSAVLVRAGLAEVHPLAGCTEIDPAAWLLLDGFAVVSAEPFAMPERERPRIPDPPPAARPSREVLAAVPDPVPERDALLERLRSAASGTAGQRGSALARFGAALRGVLAGMRRAFSGSGHDGRAGNAGAAGAGRRQPGVQALRVRTLWSRVLDWLNVRFADLLYRSRISRVLGASQARYLRDLLEMLDRGDLHEALRHAIPLADERTVEALRVALAPPRPRQQLTISPSARSARTSIALGGDLFALMREKYQAAARRLEAQRRIEEAAFVWAELLGDGETAVALLERYGRLREAAELAEGRELAPGLVVRQWFIAGDAARAVAIARRHGAFADAIARLERSRDHAEAADRLRLLYGDALAEAGDYAGAVDALWPVPAARLLAAKFLLHAFECGGAQGGRALARMLAINFAPAERLLERVRALVSDPHPRAPAMRLAFATALLGERPPTPLLRAGARAALRALIADAARGHAAVARALLNDLIALADDGALRADMPMIPDRSRTVALARRESPLELRFGANDVGNMSVHDAALLPDGRLLVALGDVGLRIYGRDGRGFSTLFEPAHRLVVSFEGTRAIAVATRGKRSRLARIDLRARRAEPWCDAEIDRFSTDFDGTRWFVGARDALIAIDTTAEELRALWRVERLSGREAGGLVDLALSASGLELWVETVHGAELWVYELGTLKLRRRSPIARPMPDRALLVHGRLRPGFGAAVSLTVEQDRGELVTMLRGDGLALPLDTLRGFPDCSELQVRGQWAALARWGESTGEVLVVHLAEQRIVLRVALERAERVAIRLGDEHLTIGDDRGRVCAVSLHDGRLLSNLRVAV